MKLKPHQRPSIIKDVKRKHSINVEAENGHMTISFKYLDRSQGQTFAEWEEDGLLAEALDILTGYCGDTLQNQCRTDKFKPYKAFPSSDKTDFTIPNHVPPDAQWASLHIKGKQCMAGHIFRNVFYIVFLDKEHRFWISDIQDR